MMITGKGIRQSKPNTLPGVPLMKLTQTKSKPTFFLDKIGIVVHYPFNPLKSHDTPTITSSSAECLLQSAFKKNCLEGVRTQPIARRHLGNEICQENWLVLGIGLVVQVVSQAWFMKLDVRAAGSEKSSNALNIEVVKDGVVPSVMGDSGNPTMEVELPTMVNETVVKENQCPVINTFDLESYPPLPTQETTLAGGNGIDVVVPVESIRAISERFVNTTSMDGLNAMLENGLWFIRNNPLILKKWHPDVNLLKEDVGIVLVWVKLYGVPVTAFSEDSLSAIATKLVEEWRLLQWIMKWLIFWLKKGGIGAPKLLEQMTGLYRHED
ncbi:pyruvate, phosphate dikinase, chloroplastic [Tanacetum coccineum]